MAQYAVTYRCGHKGTLRLFGPQKERDRRLAWSREEDCPACRRKVREEQGAKADFRFVAAPFLSDGGYVVSLQDAYPVRDQLKARGYKFRDVPFGGNFFASMIGPSGPPVWYKVFAYDEEGAKALAKERGELIEAAIVKPEYITLQTASGYRLEQAWHNAWLKHATAKTETTRVVRASETPARRKSRIKPRATPAPYNADPISIVDLGALGATVRLPPSKAIRDDFRRRFPRARFNHYNDVWGVPGKLAARRLTIWVSRIMDADTLIERQRLVDGVAFDGISSPFVTISEGECIIDTPYSDPIVSICKGLGGKWDAGNKVWRIDSSMLKAVIDATPEIDRLARLATK